MDVDLLSQSQLQLPCPPLFDHSLQLANSPPPPPQAERNLSLVNQVKQMEEQEEREEKERRDKDNTEKLITVIFKHLQAIPYYEIKRSIIFVSETDDSAFAFHKITGK